MTNDLTSASAAQPSLAHSDSENAQLMNALIRAAADPSVSAEKLSALFDLHTKMQDRAARLEFAAALARAQAKFPIVERRGKIIYEPKRPGDPAPKPIQYALWEDVIEAITRPLSEEGLSLAFETDVQLAGESYRIVIKGILSHRDGYERTASSLPLLHDGTGGKNAIQAVQSTVSYGKRMVAGLLVNFASRGEDDDGARGAKIEGSEVISEEQYKQLADEITLQGGRTLEKFLEIFEIESLGDLPAKKFKAAMGALAHRRAQAVAGRAGNA